MINFSFPAIPDEVAEARLADMERLGARPYAEIGVPMFLVAEDLTAEAAPRPPVDGSGRLLALLLAESAEALRARRPDFGPKDIGRLIEVLADRYLLGLATPAFSQTPDLHPAETP